MTESKEDQTETETFVLVDEVDIDSPIVESDGYTTENHNLTTNNNANMNNVPSINPNKNNSKLMDDSSSIGGWSEVSVPSSFGPSPNRHKKQHSWHLLEEASHGSGVVPEESKQYDECPLSKKNCEKQNQEKSNGSTNTNTMENAFSWAEITKIQPTFQSQRGKSSLPLETLNEKNNSSNYEQAINNPILSDTNEYCMSPNVSIAATTNTKKPITGTCNGNKNQALDSNKNEGRSGAVPEISNNPPSLTNIGCDSIENKENLGKRAKRGGKKRARFKYARGRDGRCKKKQRS